MVILTKSAGQGGKTVRPQAKPIYRGLLSSHPWHSRQCNDENVARRLGHQTGTQTSDGVNFTHGDLRCPAFRRSVFTAARCGNATVRR